VTDADVVLGLINPDTFLGGRKKLDRDAAARAIREHIAEPLGLTVEQAAEGIKLIIDSKMADLIRQATIHRGHDPRNFVLVAFGGAGPVHAHAFGSGLGVKQVIVPITASVHSALGIVASDLVVTHEVTRSFMTPPGSTGAAEFIDADAVNAVLADVRKEAVSRLLTQGLDESDVTVDHFVDMRFRFQIHELTIELPRVPLTGEGLDDLVARFVEVYELRFGEGSAFTAAGIELVNWRVIATGATARPPLAPGSSDVAESPVQPVRHDRVYFGGWVDAAVHDEAAMRPGVSVDGPAIFELADTNIVVGPRQRASVDDHGNLVIASIAEASDEARELEEILNG
jgi:N-methylhydantoinase A